MFSLSPTHQHWISKSVIVLCSVLWQLLDVDFTVDKPSVSLCEVEIDLGVHYKILKRNMLIGCNPCVCQKGAAEG